jgi:hypothetical protein
MRRLVVEGTYPEWVKLRPNWISGQCPLCGADRPSLVPDLGAIRRAKISLVCLLRKRLQVALPRCY